MTSYGRPGGGVLDSAIDVAVTTGRPEPGPLARREIALSAHLQIALDAGGLGTFAWDTATGATDWDERLERLFGLEPGSFGGTFDDWVELVHPEDRPEVLRALHEAIEAKAGYTVQHRVVWPDQTVHWLHVSGQVTLDDAANVTGAIGCTMDVTVQKEAERALQQRAVDAVEAANHERLHRERLEFLTRINEALAVAK